MMVSRLLLCTDMDRTIIPNGHQVEHPNARKQFAELCSISQIRLVYVTGRSLSLVKQAISEYKLPEPEYIISDVGTKIYEKKDNNWQEMLPWQELIAKDWQGKTHDQLQQALNTVIELELQEKHKQNDFKLSYYMSMDADHKSILKKVEVQLTELGVDAGLIHSVDEPEQIVLLDILPRNATKMHAIEFLQKQLGYETREIVFAGDSGNDLQVLGSSIPSILVANAAPDIKRQALELAEKNGYPDALYLAEQGNFTLGGNYTAGVLQGLVYFAPEIGEKIKKRTMRDNKAELYIFGEVLFDCFPTGEQILGGAPFNVAWHLQAFGDRPTLISRVGKDNQGTRVLEAMGKWRMDTEAVQLDDGLPTGQVDVTIDAGEPRYNIATPSAYDFISSDQLPAPLSDGILYHGTLCLRNQVSRSAYEIISRNNKLKVFLDVNLRSPWWQKEEVFDWLKKAHWVKMNQEELQLLGENEAAGIEKQMAELQTTYELEQLIVTRGAQGTIIRTAAGDFHSLAPEKALQLVDTVGAGDAFSAVYIHGLRSGWPVAVNLHHAQQFASKVIGLRGATTTDSSFYQEFMASISH